MRTLGGILKKVAGLTATKPHALRYSPPRSRPYARRCRPRPRTSRAEALEPSLLGSAVLPASLLQHATVAVSELRTNTAEASPLAVKESVPPLVSEVPRTFTVPGLLTEASAQLTSATEVSAGLLAPSIPEASISALSDTRPTPVVALTNLVLAVAVVPTESKKMRDEPAEKSTGPNREPMTLVVSLGDQKIDVYLDTMRIASSKVSSGMSDHPTKAGVFSILEKQRYHHSNIYEGAPMPWMQRLTRSGTALHGGVVPGYPASHGCIRLPFSFAPKLFQMTEVGDNVVVAHNRLTPQLINHPKLFQPLPPTAPRGVQKENASEVLAESNMSAVIPALGRAATDVSLAALPVAAQSPEHMTVHDFGASANEHTDLKAIDPSASPPDDHATTKPLWSGAFGYRSIAPLRILVTRRTERDRIIAVQYILSSLGYLTPQNFTGKLGTATSGAIRAFQKANGMSETGLFTDDLAKRVYQVAGKTEPPEGHLFVRQEFSRLFDLPVALRNPEQTLGTHLFTAMTFVPGDTKIKWLAISLGGGDAASALDRIEIPDDVRRKISERLTPGSSLIIAETSVDSAILPEGDDFLIWAKDTSTKAEKPEPKQANAETAKSRKAKVKHPQTRPAATKPWIAQKAWNGRSAERAARRYSYDRPQRFGRPWLFSPW